MPNRALQISQLEVGSWHARTTLPSARSPVGEVEDRSVHDGERDCLGHVVCHLLVHRMTLMDMRSVL
jgi:hypothetical protein